MNLHFHSNHMNQHDQEFHSKCTFTSIYTPDPRDPDVIHDRGSLFFHSNGRRKTEISGITKLLACTYIFNILRDPDFSKRAGRRSIPHTCACSCSCFSEPGSRRTTPLIEGYISPQSRIGWHPVMIHTPDQGRIMWNTIFPLESPSSLGNVTRSCPSVRPVSRTMRVATAGGRRHDGRSVPAECHRQEVQS